MKPTKNELIQFQHDIKSMAQFFDVTEQTVRRWLKYYDLYQPKENYGPKKIPHTTIIEIRKLADKYTQKELGKRYNLSQAMIGRIINNLAHPVDIRFTASAYVEIGFHA